MAGEEQPALAGTTVKAPAAVPAKVLAIVVPVIVAGAAALAFARLSLRRLVAFGVRGLAELLGLFASMAVAERFPVPVEGVSAGGVTLGFVFSVSAIILLGWPAGVIVAAGGPMITHSSSGGRRCASPTTARCSRSRRSWPGSRSSTSTGTRSRSSSRGSLLCGFLYYWVVNLILISAVLAATSGRSFFTIATREHRRRRLRRSRSWPRRR